MRGNGRKTYSAEFKREAEALVTQHGYTVVTAAQNLELIGTCCAGGSENWRGMGP